MGLKGRHEPYMVRISYRKKLLRFIYGMHSSQYVKKMDTEAMVGSSTNSAAKGARLLEQ